MSAMDHARAEELFSAYVDGELAPADRAALDEHLGACERCRGELDLFQKTVGAMHSAGASAPPSGPSAEFMDALRAQINTRSRGRFFGKRPRSYRLELISLVTLVIALTIYVVLSLAQPLLFVR